MRKVTRLNDNWLFTKEDIDIRDAEQAVGEKVTLPHTWNAKDGQDGGNDYYRGTCWYIRNLELEQTEKERYYVEFQGVNASADVYLDGNHLLHHDGGYSAFKVDLTERVCVGKRKVYTLAVAVNNAANDFVYPQKADFTFYGGIYRDVNLICVPEEHFALSEYGTPGIHVMPQIYGADAEVTIKVQVEHVPDGTPVKLSIDGIGEKIVHIQNGEAEGMIPISSVHLWNGLCDPYLYTASAEQSGDKISTLFGCRTMEVDAEQGFLLNGKPYPLHGVSRHQDGKVVGNAINKQMMEQDMELIREIGANSIRLAHYQHDQYFYELCDRTGMVVWAEIPYITCHMENGNENTISQMKELIIQNYNHPSIFCWGLSNEITAHGGAGAAVLENHKQLNELCHKLDPMRPTTMAHVFMLDIKEELVTLPDVFAYNLYYGWYLGELEDNDKWFDRFRKQYPDRAVGLSEYGADALLQYQSGKPERGDYSEQYQSFYHEHMAKMLSERPYIWCSYVWNMFDFGADGRNEGGEFGVNHKGLVSFDRKEKKDAFYIYKAYWSSEPFVHICGRRYVDRHEEETEIKVYSNQQEITLLLDGQEVGRKAGDKCFVFHVKLNGEHQVKAVSGTCSDEIKIRKVEKPNQSYILEDNAVVNWFEKEGMEAPEGYLSIKDQIGVIKQSEKGADLIGAFMKRASATRGEVAVGVKRAPEMEAMMNKMTVEMLLKQVGKAISEEEVLELNRALNQIPCEREKV